MVQLLRTHWAPFAQFTFEQSELSHVMVHLEFALQSLMQLTVSTHEIAHVAPAEQDGLQVLTPSQLSAHEAPLGQVGAQLVWPTQAYGVPPLAS